MKQKFDGYAKKYDEWFMKNENLFMSELKLFKKALGDIENKRILSVGCGSGLFESYIDSRHIEGIEPSKDMGEIAKKRGVNVIKYGLLKMWIFLMNIMILSISMVVLAIWKIFFLFIRNVDRH